MTDLFLIAHKVRGEPAFDIAQHMTCPKCEGTDDHCTQCDGVGHWFIIPTSGHRAFPYASIPLDHCLMPYNAGTRRIHISLFECPIDLRDHYTTEREAAFDLTKALGLTAKPLPPLKRRL